MGKIFISYRRGDSLITTGRIYDRLKQFYGDASLFLEIDDIPFRSDFYQVVKKEIINSDIFLVVIGPNWLPILQEKADDPNDAVRLEIETALHQNIHVVPVFLGTRSRSFKASDLPEAISKLSAIKGIIVDPGKDFESHIYRLKQELDRSLAALGRDADRGRSLADRPETIDDDFEEPAEADLSPVKSRAGQSNAPQTQATEQQLQGSTLKVGADEEAAEKNCIEDAPEEDAAATEGASSALAPEVERNHGEAQSEWDDGFPDLENEFGEALSEIEELEMAKEQFAEMDGEIELEFEISELEADEPDGPDGPGDEEDGHDPSDPVAIEEIKESDTLVLDEEELPVESTFVLEGLDLPMEEAIDDGSQPGRSVSLPRQSEPADVSEEIKLPPKRKNPTIICAIVLMPVLAIILGWWLLSGDSGKDEPKGNPHTNGLLASDVSGSFVDNDAGGKLFVIAGKVQNGSSHRQKMIRLKVSLFANGHVS